MNAQEKVKAKVKEKANKLVEKYYIDVILNEPIRTKVAIDCALILVEEMIKEHTWKISTAYEKEQLKKWEDVKLELQSL